MPVWAESTSSRAQQGADASSAPPTGGDHEVTAAERAAAVVVTGCRYFRAAEAVPDKVSQQRIHLLIYGARRRLGRKPSGRRRQAE